MHVYQKPQSYELRNSETDIFFVLLGHFLPFYPPKNPENQTFEKNKIHMKMSSFYICVPKIASYGVCFLRYGCSTQSSVILGHFLGLLLHYWPQKLKFKKKN